MIDYIGEAELEVTAKISGNLGRMLGVALSYFHRECSLRIARLEAATGERGVPIKVALIKCEVSEFEKFVRDVEKLLAHQREEAKGDDAHG